MSESTIPPAEVPERRVPRLWYLPRLTVRGGLVAVALLGAGLGLGRAAVRLDRAARAHRLRALAAAREERSWRRAIATRQAAAAEARRLSAELRPEDPDLADLWAAEAAAEEGDVGEAIRFAAHYAGLVRKYRHAGGRPWSVVAADPPGPRRRPAWRCLEPPRRSLPPSRRWYAEVAERLREEGRGSR